MSIPGGWELLIIVLVIVLLFGARKLPELARSVGRSARIFKSEVKEMKAEDQQNAAPAASAQQSEEDFWDRPENQPRAIDNQAQPNLNQTQRDQNNQQ